MKSYLFAYALVLGAAGCFNPDLSSSSFTCDTSNASLCPEGQECIQGVCAPPAVQSQNPDLAGTPPATLGPTDACLAGQGFLVSATGKSKVFACPVKYKNSAMMTADAQCGKGYSLCTTATNIDPAACSKAGQFMNGFFIANVKANRKFNSNTVACGDIPQGGPFYTVLWAGCGRTATALSCSGFTAGQDCYGTTNFQCSGKMGIGDLTNTDGASGVLCCSPN